MTAFNRRAALVGALGIAGAALLPNSAGADVWRWADTSRGRPFSKDPSVIRFGDKYFMYYSVPPKDGDTRWGQAVATSGDLHNWKRVRDIGLSICAGDAIVLNDKVHLFYQTYGGGVRDSICHATGDGINFTISRTPIFRPTGSWNNGRAIDAEARIIGQELFIYWATRDPSGTIQMIGAHSTPLTEPWVWRQRSVNGPMLKPMYPWEGRCIEAATIQKLGSTYVMFYAGNYNNKPQQIGVAYSTDGSTWKRKSDAPFLRNGAAGSWNSCESGHPGIFFNPTDGKTWLFYQGNNDMGKTWWISKRQILWDGHVPRLA